jgi:alkanesulfonate monooxygenase SsuD/methylene tetrahydromethanopterin reductase-like flavin-dependent oxidoreductase (luciferase family)
MARTVDHISGGRLVLGIGAGWYEKDYTTYGYEFGSWKSRFDLFDAGLERIEARLDQLIPPPVRKIPMLIGGTGPKRTLPAEAYHAAGATTFITEIVLDAITGYDFGTLEEMLAWRERHR